VTASDYWAIAKGASDTLALSLISILLGVPLGLVIALVRWAKVRGLQHLAFVYVSLVRACPAVTLLLLVYFAGPQFGLLLEPYPAAIVALTMMTAAFASEIWRSSLRAFPREQDEAARSFGMRDHTRFRRIVFPQVWTASLPALMSEVTLQVKSSPAVAVIGIVEITRASLRVGARTFDPLPPFLFAFCLYGVLIYGLICFERLLRRRQAASGPT
jgi:His/Glu/Gln/Arg/opine family amino acid ABC transporter permease subunit